MNDIVASAGWAGGLMRAVAYSLVGLGVLVGLGDDPWLAGVILVIGAAVLLVPTAVVVFGAVERCAGRAVRDEPYRVERCPDCDEVIDVRLRQAPRDPVHDAERLLEHRQRLHRGRAHRRS